MKKGLLLISFIVLVAQTSFAQQETRFTQYMFNIYEVNSAYAGSRETFSLADVENVIELIAGDARDYLPKYKNISFCFLDAEKDIYQECYELIVPNMAKGGILAADNVISHQEALQPMIDIALADARVDSLIVPIGKGILVCRKT